MADEMHPPEPGQEPAARAGAPSPVSKIQPVLMASLVAAIIAAIAIGAFWTSF